MNGAFLFFFLQSQGENFDNRQELKKNKNMTLKNDCCVLLLYFQPNRLHWLRALCEIYGSLFSWLKWTVASCISADGWLLFIWGISKNDNNPSLKKTKNKRGSETLPCILALCVWAGGGMWLACVGPGCSCCTL